MSIRAITENDIEQIAELHRLSRRESENGIIRDSDLDRKSHADFVHNWQDWLSDNEIYKICFEDNGVLKGFSLFGRVKTRPAFDRGVVPKFGAEIYALYVHPDYFRQGVGKALFSETCRLLQDQKHYGLILWALKKNQPAQAFYTSLNGEKVGKQRVDIGESSWAEESCFAWKDIRLL
jgi:ribosomal protein S18 acetylase RimI-like enzyme